MKNFVIVNTKGGVGKTTIGLHVLPVLFETNSINYFQIDNNNKNIIKTNTLNIKEFKINKLTEALAEIEFSDNDINIIDAGGGDDTKAVLTELADSILENLIFIIPVSKNLSIRHNIIETVNLINEKFENPVISLFLNFKTTSNPKEEFINIYGSDIYNISSLKIHTDIVGYAPDTNIFQILELNKEILLDKFNSIKNLAYNKKEILKSKKNELYSLIEKNELSKKEAEERYILFNKKVKQAEKIVELVEKLKNENKEFVEKTEEGI